MNDKKWLTLGLALLLAVLVTAACGTPSQATLAASVQEAEPTATEVQAAADTEAPAVAAAPDLATARISLSDLPAGFEELPIDESELTSGGGDNGFQPQAVFVYVNEGSFQLIMGMSFLLTDDLDRIGFQAALNEPEIMLKEFVSLWGENAREETVLEGLGHVGDTQVAMTMLADMSEVPMQMDVTMFQRGVAGAMLISARREGEKSAISLAELGTLFDRQIQDSLAASE